MAKQPPLRSAIHCWGPVLGNSGRFDDIRPVTLVAMYDLSTQQRPSKAPESTRCTVEFGLHPAFPQGRVRESTESSVRTTTHRHHAPLMERVDARTVHPVIPIRI